MYSDDEQEPPPVCKGCGEEILTDTIVQALNGDWHPRCFRCTSCGKRLNNWYIQNHGNLYCKRDYWAKFGDLCNGCSQLISGPVMVAGEHKYHPECFQCSLCQSLIGDGEAYALVERSFLYCGQCYRQGPTKPAPLQSQTTKKPLLPSTRTPRRQPHSIQMVEIPATPKHQPQSGTPPDHSPKEDPTTDQEEEKKDDIPQTPRRFQLSLQTTPSDSTSGSYSPGLYRNSFILEGGRMAPCVQISKIDSSPELKGLAVGDKILEVNGSNIRDKTLEEISNLLTNYRKPVQVMLERDLSPLRLPQDEDGGSSPSLIRRELSKEKFDDAYNSASSTDGETVVVQNTAVRLRPKANLRARGHSPTRRRSKSPSPCPAGRQKSIDLSRSNSFSTRKQDHRVFRAVDLLVGEVLGQGFFGQAIKAVHRVTGEQMVLKELHNFDEDAQKSFLREVSMLRNLTHPCVLKFLGVLYRDKKLNLVTEFIDGGTLSDLLLDHSVELSWKQRVGFAKDIASGMKYLHSMDIIHRDLNSQNCLVRKDQTVVVADFGLAKIFPRHEAPSPNQKDKEKETSSGGGKSSGLGKKKRFSRRKRQTVVGNPYWMAPEMMTKGVYDEKVDVFSFGIIVCETIARVTADPDYLPRSLDFGLNVEAFHKRFCQGAPEPYFMLAVLCSQIESEERPSFEKIQLLCEALSLHVEHGMAVPSELQGSTVQFYRSHKEMLYGQNYNDVDSCSQNTEENKQPPSKAGVSGGSQSEVNTAKDQDVVDGVGVMETVKEGIEPQGIEPRSFSSDSSDVSFDDGEKVAPTKELTVKASESLDEDTTEQPRNENSASNATTSFSSASASDVNGYDSTTKGSLRVNVDMGLGEDNHAKTTNEDYAYFSCGSTSPTPSSSSLGFSAEEFASCTSSPNSSGNSLTNCPSFAKALSSNASLQSDTGSITKQERNGISSKTMKDSVEVSSQSVVNSDSVHLSGSYTSPSGLSSNITNSVKSDLTNSLSSTSSPLSSIRDLESSMHEGGQGTSCPQGPSTTTSSSHPSSCSTGQNIPSPASSMAAITHDTQNLTQCDPDSTARTNNNLCSNLTPHVPYPYLTTSTDSSPSSLSRNEIQESNTDRIIVDKSLTLGGLDHDSEDIKTSNNCNSFCERLTQGHMSETILEDAENGLQFQTTGHQNFHSSRSGKEVLGKNLEALTVNSPAGAVNMESPELLSPVHENQLSTSRSRLKKSLKKQSGRDQSPNDL